jgi:hypothetical protein
MNLDDTTGDEKQFLGRLLRVYDLTIVVLHKSVQHVEVCLAEDEQTRW